MDAILIECWNKALHCLGTSYVFQKKAEKYEKWIRYNTILGLIVPLSVGSMALSYGLQSPSFAYVIAVAIPLSTLQIIISGISLANKWDTKLAYSLESQTANRILYDKYTDLVKFGSNESLQVDFNLIKAEDNARNTQDEKYTFTGKETRRGMRYALYIAQRQCAVCNEKPLSMDPTQCNVCGNF